MEKEPRTPEMAWENDLQVPIVQVLLLVGLAVVEVVAEAVVISVELAVGYSVLCL